jgi:4-hydroxybenzoate polyprenyltransferase
VSTAQVQLETQLTPAPITSRRRSRALLDLACAMRPAQWVKNLLLLLPLATAHLLRDPARLRAGLIAFAAFCLCASGVYLINDVLDVESDRHHPEKRLRPFAAGRLPRRAGIVTAVALLLAAFGTAWALLPRPFVALLSLYLVTSTAYSAFFKRRLLQDVFLLTGFYALRIFAGGAAVHVVISPWLMAFSMFFLLSLAFAKRYAELMAVQDRQERQPRGRGYLVDDLATIESFGPTAGYAAVLVFCLYVNSDAVRPLYHRPDFLWFAAPVLLYWITRTWFLARRRVLHDDPIMFAVKDRVSWAAAAVVAAAVVLASL